MSTRWPEIVSLRLKMPPLQKVKLAGSLDIWHLSCGGPCLTPHISEPWRQNFKILHQSTELFAYIRCVKNNKIDSSEVSHFRGQSTGKNQNWGVALTFCAQLSRNPVVRTSKFCSSQQDFLRTSDVWKITKIDSSEVSRFRGQSTKKNQNSRNCRARDHVWLRISRPSVEIFDTFYSGR